MMDKFNEVYLRIISEQAGDGANGDVSPEFDAKLKELGFKGGSRTDREDGVPKIIYKKNYGVLVGRIVYAFEDHVWKVEVQDKKWEVFDEGDAEYDIKSAIKSFIEKDDEFTEFLANFENYYDGEMKNPLNKATAGINAMLEELKSLLA